MGRISLVKAEKARAVEDMILRAAQSGQLAEKVDENKLIQLLEQIAEKQTKTKITVMFYFLFFVYIVFLDTKKKV